MWTSAAPGGAELLLLDLAAEVVGWTDIVPELIVCEDGIGEEIHTQVSEESTANFLVVGAASPTDEEIIALTRLGVRAATAAPRGRGNGDCDDCAFVRGQRMSSAYTRRGDC